MENMYNKLKKNNPCLDLGSRIGWTDYIDFITENAMSDIPNGIATGLDVYNRPFICMRILNTETGTKSVHTFFKRYTTNDSNIWCTGTCYKTIFNVTVKDSTIKLLENLIKGNTVDVNDNKCRLDVC